ncbi:MAG: LTA synthase family protein [Deltaproteobacteria bacterium]|jgi:phosphoglycerol transferase MdoB-like AlkP superfamily enzyme|nr:LTA synthase family protein [Deltaproteobacteria bacterium]
MLHDGKKNSIGPLRLYLSLLGGTWFILILARIIFAVFYHDAFNDAPQQDIFKAFYIGCRFDGRIAAIITFPIGLCLTVAPLARKLRTNAGKIFFAYFGLFGALGLVYAVDFGFYAYLGQRLNSIVIDLLADFTVSMGMIWASYPVLTSALGLFAVVLFCAWRFCKICTRNIRPYSGKLRKIFAWVPGFIIFALAAYGQISSNFFPLRWSNAYFSPNPAITALALNPAQNLYDTYRAMGDSEVNVQKTRAFYPLVADFLQVDKPDAETLNYFRHTEGIQPNDPAFLNRPNVIIIVMESMAHTKSSFAPGSENPTPFLKSLAEKSLYYSNFYANTRTTARAMFTIMTGIPDVTQSSTGTRNQRVVDQRMIADQFAGYDKFYLIGGNTSWANLRGILGNNIKGIRILEESYWKSPNLDVWGVSDWDMLREAHELFAARTQKPFLAVVQTATFHSPYSIPDDIPGFAKLALSRESKENYGFVSEAEYNGMRLADYSIAEFFRLAQTAPYYQNTIFVLVGDHGINDEGRNMNKSYVSSRLTPWHVPMLIFSPALLASGRIKAGEDDRAASQIDIFPTVAYLAGIDYLNGTLGRNLLDTRFASSRAAFVSGQQDTPLRLVRDGFCYYDNKSGQAQSEHLYKLDDAEARDYKEIEAGRFAAMRDLAHALQETSRYLLYNNKK